MSGGGVHRISDLPAERPASVGPGAGGGLGLGSLGPAASVLALQQSAGNAAVGQLLSRQVDIAEDNPLVLKPPKPKNMSVPGDDPLETIAEMEAEEQAKLVPFSPMEGDPVPGYTTPRAQYTDADRNAMNKEVTRRMVEHQENVQHFQSTFCQALVRMWGRHLTAEMEKAATPQELPMWANITKFIGETALAAVLPGGIGLLAGGLLNATFGRTATALGTHMAAFVADQLGQTVESEAVHGETKRKVAAERKKLDAETEMVAGLVKGMHETMGPALNIQWPEYGEFIWTSPGPALANLRLPKAFPKIEPTAIETGVAAGIVAGLHERPHAQDRPDDFERDPTAGESLKFFDDHQIIAHVRAGEGHSVAGVDAQVYADATFMEKLVGQPIAGMGSIPLLVPVALEAGSADFTAAMELVWAIEEAERMAKPGAVPPQAAPPEEDDGMIEDREQRVTRPREEGEPPQGDAFPWPQFDPDRKAPRYPGVGNRGPQPQDSATKARELLQDLWMSMGTPGTMRINRTKDGISVYGGGLGEYLWLYRWARGDDLTPLATQIVAAAHANRPKEPWMPAEPLPLSIWQISQAVQPELTAALVPGAGNMLKNSVNPVAPTKPDDRWDEDYFDKKGRGFTRRQF